MCGHLCRTEPQIKWQPRLRSLIRSPCAFPATSLERGAHALTFQPVLFSASGPMGGAARSEQTDRADNHSSHGFCP